MHLKEHRSRLGASLTDEQVVLKLQDYLVRRIRNGVEVLREEVPLERWPLVAARLEAAGLMRYMSKDDPSGPNEVPAK